MLLRKFLTLRFRRTKNMQILYILMIFTMEKVCHATNIQCSNVDKFLYTVPGTDCTKYYRCPSSGDRPEIEECESKSIFIFHKQACTRSSPGRCYEPVCSDRLNGVYQDTTHACMRFFTCFAGRVIAMDNCPSKQLHNGQRCMPQELVSCNAPKSTATTALTHNNGNEFDPACKNKRDGAALDPTSGDCSTYIMCKGGKFQSQRRCSYQAVFNGFSCVPSPLYQCPSTRVSDRKAPIVDLCFKKRNGFQPSPQHGCSFYMLCMYGRIASIGECHTGHYFDAESRTCIFENSMERRRCVQRGISRDCNDKSDGFYSNPNCLSYYHCYAGFKTDFKCSTNKLYNGEGCVPKTQYTCPTRGSDAFCANRPDGYHKDYNDGCRSYHFCSNGHKITYLCEEGYTFDSQAKKCVRQQFTESDGSLGHRCRSDYVCYGKSDGYHADYRSNCRKYVYCKNYDKITQLTCRENNVFNGQKCVPPREYACPSLYNHRQLNCMPKHCIQRCQNDGFYPDLHSDCRDYFFCIGGKASKLSCPLGRRFNGEVCVPEDSFSCPEFCNHYDELSSCPSGRFVS